LKFGEGFELGGEFEFSGIRVRRKMFAALRDVKKARRKPMGGR